MTAIPKEFIQAQQLQALSRAAVAALGGVVRTELSMLFNRCLQRLPDVLIDSSLKVLGDAERRSLQELSRNLAAQSVRWCDTFLGHIESQWQHGVREVADTGDKMLASADEAIALATVEMRADSLYRPQLSRLKGLVEQARPQLYLPLHVEALAPASLFRALQETAQTLRWPANRRRVLVMSFDVTVINGLKSFYQALDAQLSGFIGQAHALQSSADEPQPQTPAVRATEPVPRRVSPAQTPQVDSKTLSMLMGQAAHSSTQGYSDGALAADLLSLASNEPLPDVPREQTFAPLQRMELAGTFLNESIADPLIPEALRPQHESVRFPLVKSALTDATFFTAVTHPLRSLVNELLLKSATSHVTGNSEAKRMAELLQQVLVQFDLAPDFVREAMLTAEPIAQDQIDQFFEMQRQQTRQRRDAVVGEAKRLVIRELELSTFGRDVPASVLKFLNQAWGPLLARRLLKLGAAHSEWKAGLATMDALVDQIEAREPAQAASEEWMALLQKIQRELLADGLVAEKLAQAIALLEAARSAKRA